MMKKIKFKLRRALRRFYHNLPGKPLGSLRLIPLFFIFGGLMEFTMIHWHVGEVNFYKVYKRKRIEEAVQRRLQEMNS